MKLYVCLTTYHMLAACAMAIKDDANTGDLLVESFVDDETEIVLKIRESGIFKNVFFINQAEAWTEINKLDSDSNIVQIDDAAKSAVRFWNEHFNGFSTIENHYSDINIWDDHFTFGIALAYLKKSYNYFEESPGCHCRRDVFLQLSRDKITNKAFAPMTETYGVRGEYPYAKNYFYDFQLNKMDRTSKDVNFSLIDELRFIKNSSIYYFNIIKSIFAPDGYFFSESTLSEKKNKRNFLLIGQHYSVNTYGNVSTIRYVLSLLVDYFGKDMNLWIKNHPSNYFNPLYHWFDKAQYINEKIPLELLIADEISEFDRVASISSSAPLVFKESQTEVILFQNEKDGDSFESQKRFLDLHKYYITASLINLFCADNSKEIDVYTCGAEILSLEFLFKYNLGKNVFIHEISEKKNLRKSRATTRKSKIYIFDKLRMVFNDDVDSRKLVSDFLSTCTRNDIVFFINSDNDDIFFDVENCKNMEYIYPLPFDVVGDESCGLFGNGFPESPLKNTISKLDHEGKLNHVKKERQIIYMYTQNDEVAKMMLSHRMEKKLHNCGLQIQYNPLSNNYREVVFESMLEQLEKQYILLQEENKMLKESEEISMLKVGVDNQEIERLINESMDRVITHISRVDSQSSTMLMDRLTEIDGRIIRFSSWYGLKERIKDKIKKLFNIK